MITVDASVAAADCLFYVVHDAAGVAARDAAG